MAAVVPGGAEDDRSRGYRESCLVTVSGAAGKLALEKSPIRSTRISATCAGSSSTRRWCITSIRRDFCLGIFRRCTPKPCRVNPADPGRGPRNPETLRHGTGNGMATATASPLLRMQARRLTKRFLKETPDRSASLARVRYGRGRIKSGPGIFRRGIAETASTTRRRTLFNAWKQASASRRKRASIWRRRSRRWRQRMRARPRTDA